MIGAGDSFGVAGTRQELVGPVRTHVIEGPQYVGITANDDDALVMDVSGDIVARCSDLFGMADILPSSEKHGLLLPLKDLAVVIIVSGQHIRSLGVGVRSIFIGSTAAGRCGDVHSILRWRSLIPQILNGLLRGYQSLSVGGGGSSLPLQHFDQPGTNDENCARQLAPSKGFIGQ